MPGAFVTYLQMTLLTAHRILISAAIVFFLFLSLWQLNNYLKTKDIWACGGVLIYLLVAGGFGVYLKSLKRWYR
jgi:hypothetical protein